MQESAILWGKIALSMNVNCVVNIVEQSPVEGGVTETQHLYRLKLKHFNKSTILYSAKHIFSGKLFLILNWYFCPTKWRLETAGQANASHQNVSILKPLEEVVIITIFKRHDLDDRVVWYAHYYWPFLSSLAMDWSPSLCTWLSSVISYCDLVL